MVFSPLQRKRGITFSANRRSEAYEGTVLGVIIEEREQAEFHPEYSYR